MKCLICGSATHTLETREGMGGVALRRRRECKACKKRFSTFEINERLFSTIRKHMGPHAVGMRNRWALTERNKQIVARVKAGEKRYLLAEEFGVTSGSISHITRKAGLRARVGPKSPRSKHPPLRGEQPSPN